MAAKHGHGEHHEWTITEKVIVQDLLSTCPQAEAVIRKHLGEKALLVPGARTESIEFLAAMYDYHVELLLEEINQVCKKHPPKVGHF